MRLGLWLGELHLCNCSRCSVLLGLLWRDWWAIPVSSSISSTQHLPSPSLLADGMVAVVTVPKGKWGESRGALGAPVSQGFFFPS